MSSLALMRLLESAPARYDAGIRMLTLGKVAQIHAAVAEAAARLPGAAVLEIGCGTGAVTEAMVARGARVTAIDHNPEMLERGRARLASAPPGSVTFAEKTGSEIDGFPDASFDAVAASLSFSEMSRRERGFILKQAMRVLRPGGSIAIADEVLPRAFAKRLIHAVMRAPQALFGWLIVGSVSRPIEDLSGEVVAAGFILRVERRWMLESLALVIAERPK